MADGSLDNHSFSIEMGKAKPKIIKNVNALYKVFIPKQSQQTLRKNSNIRTNAIDKELAPELT